MNIELKRMISIKEDFFKKCGDRISKCNKDTLDIFLDKLIIGVLKQNYIVLVNNGSTFENLFEFLKEKNDERLNDIYPIFTQTEFDQIINEYQLFIQLTEEKIYIPYSKEEYNWSMFTFTNKKTITFFQCFFSDKPIEKIAISCNKVLVVYQATNVYEEYFKFDCSSVFDKFIELTNNDLLIDQTLKRLRN